MSGSRRVVIGFAATVLVACSSGAALRGQLRGVNTTLAMAEKNGAVRCAPRELALAKAHAHFAEAALDRGDTSSAEDDLAIAEPNARAALDLSPANRCARAEAPADKDADGIADNDDKCPSDPETYNGFQDTDGCPDDPDTDGDGITDANDQCVLEPEDKDNYADDDGCPDLDNDSDGIRDASDKCPNQAEDLDGFQDADGCPDPDNDSDGVADIDDFCPNTPGFAGGTKPGCPRRMSWVVLAQKEIRITQPIQFVNSGATIRPISFKVLDEVAEVLRDDPTITLEVQGHTDNRGAPASNLALSQRRADSVRNYLIKIGVAPSRLSARGYGMTQPIVPNTSAANQALNRRIQLVRTDPAAGS